MQLDIRTWIIHVPFVVAPCCVATMSESTMPTGAAASSEPSGMSELGGILNSIKVQVKDEPDSADAPDESLFLDAQPHQTLYSMLLNKGSGPETVVFGWSKRPPSWQSILEKVWASHPTVSNRFCHRRGPFRPPNNHDFRPGTLIE